MNRHEKEMAVAEIKDLFSKSQAVFLVNYRGLTVSNLQSLRKHLRKCGGKFKVTKARLMKIATNDVVNIDGFKLNLKDQVGLIFAPNEAFSVAKQIVDFSKENQSLKLLSGVFESKVLSLAEINTIASLPPKDVLLSMVIGTIQAPMSALVRVLSAVKEKTQQL
ncbi:MAG: 50S ribosomal protein L10 [candidate division TM6 bacterium GW2011_GWF2_37_49]|nr:MAG: 50S ribosomal protein L10 [candidate division TM6 bacterium GW2011_GWF2_37_49]